MQLGWEGGCKGWKQPKEYTLIKWDFAGSCCRVAVGARGRGIDYVQSGPHENKENDWKPISWDRRADAKGGNSLRNIYP
jgi:hypothetical protein